MIFKLKYFILFVLVLSTLLVFFIVLKTEFKNESGNFETMVYKTNKGYGYSIQYNNKLYIKQDNIPSIKSNHPFCNFGDANKVANLVVKKLNKKENPRITASELKALNIKLNCIN